MSVLTMSKSLLPNIRLIRCLFTMSLIIIVLGCSSATPTVSGVKQMYTAYWEIEDELEEAGTWTVMPHAATIIKTTAEASTLTVLFVAESAGAQSIQTLTSTTSTEEDHTHTVGDIGITGSNGEHAHTSEVSINRMTPVMVRIKIDGEETFPPSGQFMPYLYVFPVIDNPLTPITEDNFATHSFLAFRDDIEPGTHSITVEWRSASAGALVRNRTLTVWETVREDVSK